MTNTPATVRDEVDARRDAALVRAAVDDCVRADRVSELYHAVNAPSDPYSHRSALEAPAGDWTVVGWRFAATLAEGAGEPDIALEYRRRALEAAGLSRDLPETSSGFLLAIYPPLVDVSAETTVVTCTIPTTKRGEPCTFAIGRTGAKQHEARDRHLAHVINDHSTTAGAPGAEPGDAF